MKQNIIEKIRLTIIYVVFILIFCNLVYGDNSVLDELQNAKESSLIIQNCRNWISKNTNSPDFYNVLLYYYSIEENPNALLPILKDALIHLSDKQQGEILLKIAQLEELMMQISNAQSNYHKAAIILQNYGNEWAFWNSARLLYELGFYENALKELTEISNAAISTEFDVKIAILKGFLYLELTKTEEAGKILGNIATTYRDSDFIRMILDYCTVNIMNKLNKQFFTQLLKMLNADNLINVSEVHSLQNPKVKSPNLPNMIITDNPNMPRIYIQTGSFSVKENAEYMLLDLKKAGYTVLINEKKVKDEKYYIVIVEANENINDINVFLKELRTKGFDGFKVQLESL